jgi:hypothetical protein
MSDEGKIPRAHRCCLLGMIVFSAAGTIFSLCYLAVNLTTTTVEYFFNSKYLVDWPKLIPFLSGFTGLLFDISFDRSAVTPIICLIFFSSLLYNSVRLFSKGKPRSDAWVVERWNHLPFIRNYSIVFIQLGFIGTLISFVVIGFQMERYKTIDIEQISSIMKMLTDSFGTAIWSTLTGVVFAYVVGPPIQFAWRKITGKDRKFYDAEYDGLANETKDLIKGTNAQLESLKERLEAMNAVLRSLYDEINGQRDGVGLRAIADIRDRLGGILDAALEEKGSASAIRMMADESSKRDALLGERISAFERIMERLNVSLEKFNENNAALPERLKGVEDYMEGYRSRIDAVMESARAGYSDIFRFVSEQNAAINSAYRAAVETGIISGLRTDISAELERSFNGKLLAMQARVERSLGDMEEIRKKGEPAEAIAKSGIRRLIDAVWKRKSNG